MKAVLVGTAAATALALAPGGADADFTFLKCQGSDIAGIGASFQNNAQAGFIELFGGSNGCNGSPIVQPYNGAGSGAGRRAFGERGSANPTGARDPLYRYVAVDEAPNATQRAQIQSGPIDGNGADVTAGDDGLVRVVPVAVGATALTVNYPDNCTLPAASATSANGPGTISVQDGRLKLTNAQLEAVWAAQTTTWGALVPGITGFNGKTDSACANQAIRRVVRFDDSGTTFAFKLFLNSINGARGWNTAPLNATPNTTWPRVGGSPTAPVSGASCATDLCSSTANGNGALLTLQSGTDGSFGYSDIRTGRGQGFELTPNQNTVYTPAAADTTYWMQLQNSNVAGPSNYFEPTSDPNAFKPGANPGANCASAVFANLPADTLGDFSQVTGANSPTGYPLCAITYMLLWDDYAKVYGSSDTEQRKARTARDYIDMILGSVAQAGLPARDYQALPAALLALAQGGASQVNFAKGSGGANPNPTPTPTVTPTVTATVSPTATPTPSNAFTIQSARVSKSKAISLTLQLPGKGVVAASALIKGKGVQIGSATATVPAAGSLSITIKASKKLKDALKKIKNTKSLTAQVGVSFTPTGGTPKTLTKNVSIKGTKKPKKKR